MEMKERKKRREEREQIAANFAGSGRGLLTNARVDTSERPLPSERFRTSETLKRWRYNPESGMVELA